MEEILVVSQYRRAAEKLIDGPKPLKVSLQKAKDLAKSHRVKHHGSLSIKELQESG